MTVPVEAERVRVDTAPPSKRLLSKATSNLASAIRRVPPPLAAVLVIVAIVGVSWALLVPPWQSPDEGDHFAYAQSLAERLALPGAAGRPGWSTDQNIADAAALASQNASASAQMRFDWRPEDAARYRAEFALNPSRSDGGGFNSAETNPPLYYLYVDLAYWAAYSGDAFDRLYAMRIWSAGLLILTTAAAWLLAGEVLGRRRLPQLACAACVGLIPMQTAIAGSLNPDALLVALSTAALWLGARVIMRGARPADAIALCAITSAAILTKATAYFLVPPAALALLVGWRRADAAERWRRLRVITLAATLCATPVIGWIAVQRLRGQAAINAVASGASGHSPPFNIPQFLGYIWQFYLPRLPGMTPFRATSGLPVYDTWIRQGWGVFGWLELTMPSWLYGVLAGACGFVAVASAAIVARFRDRIRWSLVAFFATALVVLLFGLHYTEYRSIVYDHVPILQGRYILPLSGLFGLAVALILTRLPARWRAPACGVVVAAMLLVQVLALATVAQRYYT
jgi:4-amino-4-deoxy-L-arabinose transferase-like glycosyltransferase